MPFAARKTKKKNGFTLSEVLVVVALIAVLLAFAVPAILGYVRRLKLRALDTDAETIFWAAQHRLTAMAASGELDMLHTKPDADGNDPYRLYINADGVVSTASLADGAVYAWLGSDAPADAVQLDLADILPFGAIESELRAGHFAIEFSKETGAVYAVWYTDEDGFDYAAGINGRPDSEDLETRLQKSPLVGFFGGGIIERPEIGQLPIPRVSVTNTNLLYIDIALPGTDAAITPNISVTLTGADSHAELTLPLEGAATVRGLDAGKIGRVVLDMLPGGDPLTGTAAPNLPAWTVLAGGSMYNGTAKDTTGCQFKDWAAGSDLRPGEDITVTVTVSLDGYLPQRMRVQTNSLFANLFTDTDANGDGLGDSTGLDIAVAPIAIAQIAYGRHLQNLDPGISGVPDVQTSTWKETDPSGREETKYSSAFLPGAVRAAQQVRDIDFSMPDTLPDGWQDAYWALVYKDYTGVNPLNPTFTQGKAFTPITNAALACFDGNEEFIRNLRVDAPGSGFGAGLFDTVGNSFDNACEIYLKNIVLVNATVDVPYAFAVGSLAGSTTSKAHIDNCQVYLDSVGDIPKDNGVPIPWVSCETAMANVGGMVGALYADAELTNSFAATVTNGAQAGGMVGMSVNATFDRCYASGYIIAAQLGGGLLASSGNMQITNCYVTGTIDVSSGSAARVGGICNFRGSDPIGSISNCYAAVHVELPATPGSTEIFGISPYGDSATNPRVKISRAYYVAEVGVDYVTGYGESVSSQTLAASPLAESDDAFGLLNGTADDPIWYTLSKDSKPIDNPSYAAFPYRLTDDYKDLQPPYPYPMLASPANKALPMIHYGDWAEEDFTSGRVVYFEEYNQTTPGADTNYSLYGLNFASNGSEEIFVNTLQYRDPNSNAASADRLYATADGYLVLSATELETARQRSYLINGHDKVGTPLTNVNALFVDMDPYQLIPVFKTPGDSNSGTQQISVPDPDTGELIFYYMYRLGDNGWQDLLRDAKRESSPYYQTVTLLNGTSTRGDDRLCLINPLFACEAINYGDTNLHYDDVKVEKDGGATLNTIHTKLELKDGAGHVLTDANVTNGILIRTARQLAELGDYTTAPAYDSGGNPLLVRTDMNSVKRGGINADGGTDPGHRHWYQLLDIDYAAYTRDREISGGYYDATTKEFEDTSAEKHPENVFGTGKSDAKPQAPIVLHDNESYDGGNYIIRGLHTGVLVVEGTNDSFGGLFGWVKNGCKVQNVRLVNTRARAAGVTADGVGANLGSYRLRSGALVGLTAIDAGTLIRNCGVYVEEPTALARDGFGKPIAGGPDNYSYYCVDAAESPAGEIYAGGLVGTLSGSNSTKARAEDSFAAVKVTANPALTASYAGGLIGSGQGVAKNCYAGGHTEGGVYTSANVSAATAGGFLGQNVVSDSFTVEGVCYSTCSVSGTTRAGAFCGNANVPHHAGATLYATGTVLSGTPTDETSYLTAPEGGRLGPDQTFNYDPTLKDTAYPYATNLNAHYGDWVRQEPATTAVYYEKYIDGATESYGFYGPDGKVINTLKKGAAGGDGGEVKEHAAADGYAILVPQGTTPGNVSYAPAAPAGSTGTSLTARLTKLAQTVNVDGTLHDVYVLPDIAVAADANTYYYTLRVGRTDIAWFNPHFACEVHEVPTAGANANTPLSKPDAGGPGTDAVSAGQVAIRTARQLVNLSKYTNLSTDEGTRAQGRTYRQLLDIDFPAYKGLDGTLTLAGAVQRDPDPNKGNAIVAPDTSDADKLFIPIHLKDGKYYGNEHIICDMHIVKTISDSATSAAGVFGVVEGTDALLDGIRLLNIKIYFGSDSSDAVGALAGVFRGGAINNCGVYVMKGKSSTGKDTENHDYDRSYYRDYGIASNNGNAIIGGLVGQLQSGSASSSFAAVKVHALKAAGGFAGSIGDDVTVENCYAGGYTVNKRYVATAEASGTDTVSVGTSGSGFAGGFAGQLGANVTFKGICYSTCTVSGDTGTNVGLFAGNGAPKALAAGENRLLYATGKAYTLNASKEYISLAPRAEGYLETLVPVATAGAARAIPYDQTGSSYPYASALGVHHGDWPTRYALVYYEVYDAAVAANRANADCGIVKQGSQYYGFYGSWYENAVLKTVNTLAHTGYAVDSGYAVITDSAVWNTDSTFTVDTVTYGTAEQAVAVNAKVGTDSAMLSGLSGALAGKTLYTLPYAALNTAPTNHYYRAVSIDGSLASAFNPHFACEALNTPNTAAVTVEGHTYGRLVPDTVQTKTGSFTVVREDGTEEKLTDCADVVIRTPRDLANLARYTRDNNGADMRAEARVLTYHQLLDLDFAQYNKEHINDGVHANAGTADDRQLYPIRLYRTDSVAGTPQRRGTYNGHEQRILNVYLGRFTRETHKNDGDASESFNSYAGLFGNVQSGELLNIRLVNARLHLDLNGVTDTNPAVGMLVGYAAGNTGVTNCGVYVDAVANYDDCGVETKNSAKTTYVGGLIGAAGDDVRSISNSFAAVKVSAEAANSSTNVYAGGFAGQINGSEALSNCYAAGHTVNGSFVSGTGSYLVNVAAKGDKAYAGGFVGNFREYVPAATGQPAEPIMQLTGVNYSTCSVGASKEGQAGLFFGMIDETGADGHKPTYNTATLYALGEVFDFDGANRKSAWTGEEGYLTSRWAVVVNDRTARIDAKPYDAALGAKYPYLTGDAVTGPVTAAKQTVHHGDWVALAEPSFAYYEKYKSNNTAGNRVKVTDAVTGDEVYYGFGGTWTLADGTPGSTGTVDISTLSAGADAADVPDEGGYAILWPVDEDSFPYTGEYPETIQYTVGSVTSILTRVTGSNSNGTVTLLGKQYYLYLLTPAELATLTPYDGGDYYRSITVSAVPATGSTGNPLTAERWFNPDFALEAYNAKPAEDLTKPTDKTNALTGSTKTDDNKTAVIVRTAQQFDDLAQYTAGDTSAAAGWNFHQTLDISEAGSFTAAPVPYLTGLYDGHDHTLGGVTLDADTALEYVGVFGQVVGGTVQNVKLENTAMTLSSGNCKAAGGLVGLLSYGTLQDIGINGLKITTDADPDWINKSPVGGIVGRSGNDVAGTSRTVQNVTGNDITVEVSYSAADSSNNVGGGFGLINNKTIVSNVVLTNVRVAAKRGQNVGGMFGRIAGSTEISGCGLYVDPDLAVTGHADIASAYANYCVSADTCGDGTTAGGLLGLAGSGVTVTNSFAAVQVSGEGEEKGPAFFVGGFAGELDIGMSSAPLVANCYAGGYTVDGTYTAASVNVEAKTTQNAYAGGFAGRVKAVAVKKEDDSVELQGTPAQFRGVNYTTCSVRAANEANCGLFLGENDDAFVTVPTGETAYALGPAFKVNGDPLTTRTEPYLTPEPKAAVPLPDSSAPYAQKLAGQPYPYLFGSDVTDAGGKTIAVAQTMHHGDWPAATNSGGGGTTPGGGMPAGGGVEELHNSTDSNPQPPPLTKDDVAMVVLYRDLSIAIWDGNGNVRRWGPLTDLDTCGSEISGVESLPAAKNVVTVGLLLKGAKSSVDDSRSDIKITIESVEYGLNLVNGTDHDKKFYASGELSDSEVFKNVFKGLQLGGENIVDMSSYPMPDGYSSSEYLLLWYTDISTSAAAFDYSIKYGLQFGSISSGAGLTFSFGTFEPSNEDLPLPTSSAPAEPGPSISGSNGYDGPEIFDDPLPPSNTAANGATPEGSGATPESTTPESAPAPTPAPAKTPEPTPEPAETPTPQPTETSAPESTPKPTPEPAPEPSPAPTAEPASGSLLPPA